VIFKWMMTYVILVNPLGRPAHDPVRVHLHGDFLALGIVSLALNKSGRDDVLLLISELIKCSITLDFHLERQMA
jgi:hypothetical protein